MLSMAPVKIGTRPTSSKGTRTMIASHFWALAVEAMPRCWMVMMTSISATPIRKVELKCKVPRPGTVKAKASNTRNQGVIAATPSAAATALMASAAVTPALAAM